MRKALTAGLAALTFGTAVAATALPAYADGRHYRRHDNGDVAAAAIVAGVAGLALGSALSSGHSNTYYGYRAAPAYGYAPGYAYGYGPGYAPGYAYGYGYAPRVCESRRWVWDPYIGRRVLVRSTYRC